MKHKWNVSFLEKKKYVETYMGENSYASVAQSAITANDNNKYRTLVKELIQLEANNWATFQEHQKKTIVDRILPSTSSATNWE